MDDEAVAYVCGECGDVRAAHWRPDFCGACHARFDLGAPVALVTLELGVTTSGGALELAPRYVCNFHGDGWTAEGRERVEGMFGHVTPPSVRSCAREPRTDARPRGR